MGRALFSRLCPGIVARLVFFAVSLLLVSCVRLPGDLKSAREANDGEKFAAIIETRFKEHLGQQFPDLSLQDWDGRRTTLRQLQRGPIVLLYAGGPCPYTLSEIHVLENQGWRHPKGAIITVLKNRQAFKQALLRDELRDKPDVYAIARWQEDDTLQQYMRMYPIYFFLDEWGKLTAFKIGVRELFTITDEAKKGNHA